MATPATRSDVALDPRAAVGGRLDRVGTTEIELPVRIATPDGVANRIPARVDAFVSLDDASANGIHRSRLFPLAQETLEKELLTLATLIDRLEACLATRVQAAVKRLDEQEFARRNGVNPMLCEDAERCVPHLLGSDPHLLGHAVGVEHQDSLHTHNAVSRVAGGTLRASR